MDPRLQRRVQRYGWDRAVSAYEEGWRAQLEPAHSLMLDMVALEPGLRVLDVACGTGHLLRMLGAALPSGTKLFGVDLSPHYIARAREVLPRDLDISLICDNAESLPFLDGSFDVVTSVYLLHEIPAEVRTRVLQEIARVVRPGGTVVVADSIQLADAVELEREILAFPARFHEPYYMSYVKDDLAARVEGAGLKVTGARSAFLTKLVTAARPAAAPAAPTNGR